MAFPFPDQVLENGTHTIADEYAKYLMGETRETSHPIVIVRDGYLTMSTKT